jgi:hypothetical protein
MVKISCEYAEFGQDLLLTKSNQSSSREIALFTQAGMQIPSASHLLLSITALPFTKDIAFSGHTLAHSPLPLHFCLSITIFIFMSPDDIVLTVSILILTSVS